MVFLYYGVRSGSCFNTCINGRNKQAIYQQNYNIHSRDHPRKTHNIHSRDHPRKTHRHTQREFKKKKIEKEMEVMEDVVIVGAGIAGLATAVALKRVGIEALVLERSEVLRTTGAALTLFPNALLALNALGVSHNLTSLYPPLIKGSVTNVATGATQEILLSGVNANRDSASFGPRAVHRRNLLEALAHEIPADRIRFSSKITAIETEELGDVSIAVVHLNDGTTIKAKVLIGCEGVHSVVAKWLGLKEPVHSGRSAVRGLAVYPQGHGFKQDVQQFVYPGKRGGLVPLNDKEIYWFLAFKGENAPADPKLIQKEVIENHANNFPPTFLDVAQHADLSSLSCAPLLLRYPWQIIFGNFRKGTVTVAGDAMHPMTPDLGQGGCSALEDAVVLGRHIGNSFIKNGKLVSEDIALAIDEYIKERRWRVAGLVTGSYLSGWIQQDGSKWWMKFLRDRVFYRSFRRVAAIMQYDCGKLPVISHDEAEDPSKID